MSQFLVTILPFLIMITLAGIVIFIYRLTIKAGKKFITGGKIYVMLISYIVILLISAVIFIFMPLSKDTILSEKVDAKNIPNKNDIYYEVNIEGKSINQFSEYIDKEWTFDFTENILDIQQLTSEGADIPIIIEMKNEADNILEVISYRTPTTVDGIDVTDRLIPIGITFSSNRLQIEVVENRLDVVSFGQGFITKQFSNDPKEDEWEFDRIHKGSDLLYIRIPNGVKVE